MPVLIPIIVAGAAYFGTGAVLATAFGAAMVGAVGATVAGVVVGAVIGAAVGAIGAAVTGGDIGKGALWGAVGGAVAGGFAGYGAAGSSPTTSVNNASLNALNGQTGAAGADTGLLGTTTTEAGMSTGEGMMYGSMVETAGKAVTGYAQGEAAGDIAAEDRAAAEKTREEQFAQNMKEIQANHENSMAAIAEQGGASMALADKNNTASMDRLNTGIGADKDTANAVIADRESEQNQFNESVMGTDKDLFNRPTFDFNPGAENTASFDSGFRDAAEQSPNTPSLTPEEEIALQAHQATA